MPLTIAPYEFEAPFKLDGAGRLEICDKKDAAFFAEVSVGISADSPDEWRVTDVGIGAQVLTGMNLYRMAEVIARAREAEIADHIGENIGEALVGTRCDEARFMAA